MVRLRYLPLSLSLFFPLLPAVMLMIHQALAQLGAISSSATHRGIVATPQHLEVSQLKSATLAIFSQSVESFFKF
jgi:cation transporter-like permease